MKSILTLTALSLLSTLQANPAITSGGESGCSNKYTTVECKDICNEDTGFMWQTICWIAGITNSSAILNASYEYIEDVEDYATHAGSSSCGSCSASSSSVGALPSLEVIRRSRPRFNIFTMSFLNGSFGLGGTWAKYDKGLFLTPGGSISLLDGDRNDPNISLTFDPSRQAWADLSQERIASLTLFDGNGVIITDPANRNQAHTAVLLEHNGEVSTYDLFYSQYIYNNAGYGRLTSLLDKNNNSIEIEYTHDIEPDRILGSPTDSAYHIFVLEKSMWKKSKVRDAYGKEILVENVQGHGLRFNVSKLHLPNGRQISYSYGNLTGFTNGALTGVTHPDGTTSTWTSSIDAATGIVKVEQFDAAATAFSRKKSLEFSMNYALDNDGNIISTSSRLIRRVTRGNGEVSYQNRAVQEQVDGVNKRFLYIHEGGNKIYKATYANQGGATSVARVTGDQWKNGFYSTDPTTWTLENLTSQSFDFRALMTADTDAFGREESYTRNLLAPTPLAKQFSDQSTASATFNHFQQPLSHTDRLNRKSAYTYDLNGNLLSETNALGTADETTTVNLYNSRGQLIEARDALYDIAHPELHNTQYVYNAAGYLIKKIDSADEVGGTRPETLFAYNSAGQLTSTTDPIGRVTQFEFGPRNRQTKTTFHDGSYEEVTYGTGSLANLVISSRSRNGTLTTYEHDLSGREIKTTVAAGTPEAVETTCTYLPGTQKKTSVTRKGDTTLYGYNFANNLVSTTVKADAQTDLTTTRELDQDDRLRSTCDAFGRKTFLLYDQNDNIIKIVSETVPGALQNIPAITPDATQTTTAHIYTLTDKAGNTLSTSNTHKVTYTCAHDLFLANLERDLDNNAAYLIRENVYDSEGQLLISTDSRGISTWTEFDHLGRNTRTIRAVGTNAEIRSEIDYDKNSNVIVRRSPRYFTEGAGAVNPTLPNVGVDTYTYNGRNLKASYTVAKGSTIEATESWTYYLDGRQNEHSDFRGNVAKTLWHACCGRFQGFVQRDGTSTTISNTDFYGNVTHTAVIRDGDVSSPSPTIDFHNPDNAKTLRETTTRFDPRNRPTHTTQWLVPLGNVIDHARPNLGTGNIPIAGLDGIPAENGLTTKYTYDDDLTDGTGIDSTYATQLAVLTARFGYSPFGAGTDGSAVAIANPAGETSVRIMDSAGRTILTINPEVDIATVKYDHVTSDGDVSSPSPAITIPGNLLTVKTTDANGNSSIAYTDAAGRTLITEDAIGNRAYTAYDANSNTVLARDPNGLGHSCTFDELDREISCEDQQETQELASRTKTYNADSQIVTSTNAEGHTATNVFDERGRKISVTDPNGITNTLGFDANSNLISLTDGEGHTRTWTVDARNLRIQKTNPGSDDILLYSYDALGRMKTRTDQLEDSCEFFYDLAGRMVKKEYKYHGDTLESTDTFSYDSASRLTTSHKGRYNVTTNHSYAADSMPIAESFIIDGRTYNQARAYDPGNRHVSHTFHGGKQKAWTYTQRNLVKTLSYDGDLVVTNSHDPGYRLTHQVHANGLAREITYGRLDNLRTSDVVKNGLSTIGSLNLEYAYNSDKQVTAETTVGSFLSDSSFTATYDPGDRIKTWTRAGVIAANSLETEEWEYDNAGNKIKVTKDGKAQNRTFNEDNELTKIKNKNLKFDAKGNLIEDDEKNKYFYDLDNRIYKIEMKGNKVVEFKYGAFGRRVYRESNKGTNKKVAIIWWGDQEIAEYKATAGQAAIQHDLWAHPTALNKIIARAVDGDKNKIEHYHANYLDHVYAVSNSNGKIIEHYRYSAFGEVEIYSPTGQKLKNSAIANYVRWNKRREDPLTGLLYYKYRHYSPRLARWLGRDPIEEDGGYNLYAFVGNNVINQWDSLGKAVASSLNTNTAELKKKVRNLATKMDAKWVIAALNEYGVAEIPGKKENKEIRKYYNSCKAKWVRNYFTDDSGSKNAWCGCFCSYVLQKSGYSRVKFKKDAMDEARAKCYSDNELPGWCDSKTAKFGSIVSIQTGSRSRGDSGNYWHTGIIVAEVGSNYVVLGGNQDNKVQFKLYPKDWVHSDNYKYPCEKKSSDPIKLTESQTAGFPASGKNPDR